MNKLFDNAAAIIREAARSPLGVLALLVISVALLSLAFFHDSSDLVKLIIFLTILVGAGFFGAKMFQLAASADPIANQASETSISEPAEPSHEPSPSTDRSTLQVFAGPAVALPPFPVEAFVIEQDRDLLLDPDPILREPKGSLKEQIRAAKQAKPKEAGSVIVAGESIPYTFLAIVHDFSAEPSWREGWVAQAFEAVLHEANALRLNSIGLPLLGSVHGKVAPSRAVELLRESLDRVRPGSLKNLWLLSPKGTSGSLWLPLREAGYRVTVGR